VLRLAMHVVTQTLTRCPAGTITALQSIRAAAEDERLGVSTTALADAARRAAAAVGLDVCGVDIRFGDIAAPVGTGAVIEINASPGLRMHLAPAEGAPRDVAGAVIDRMYPPGAPRRIPIVSVTGTNGKTTTVRMIGHILRQAGLHVGMSTTDGVYRDGRLVYEADASRPRSAGRGTPRIPNGGAA
jgi:cyanophycin synthetase